MTNDVTVVTPIAYAKRLDDSVQDEVRVVVVDDVLDTVDVLAMMLEMDGYKVMTAGDAFHALRQWSDTGRIACSSTCTCPVLMAATSLASFAIDTATTSC